MKLKTWFLLLIIFGGCKDKYMPNIKYPTTGFLVVEGYINSGKDSTMIYLSRTSGLDSIQIFPESGAQVEVQSDQGASYPLSEKPGGKYTVDQLPLDPAQKYRLHIKTSNGKEYLSDLTEVKISPPIDSISWKTGTDLVTIYVSTHDDQKKSVYYQWSFEETWEYSSPYISNYIFDPQNINADSLGLIPRSDASVYYTCWLNNQSSSINIASTASLNADVIHEFPLQTISYDGSNRLTSRYSILIKQNVLSKEGYEWKEKLKKNTEELGSIFDAQPSESGGNVHCLSDPTEQVIGFIGCSSQTERRIFIDRGELPNVFVLTGFENCSLDTVAVDKAKLVKAFGSGYEWVIDRIQKGTRITGLTGAPSGCIDCRAKGGINVKPSYW